MNEQRHLRALALKGAGRVFQECLPTNHGDAVALFYDEQSRACAEVLNEAARARGLRLTPRFVATADQLKLADSGALDRDDEAAIETARAVVLCLSSAKGAMPYRRRLVQRAVDDTRYVGLMPGATLELLAYAVNIDYERVESKCDDLAVAMLMGQTAVLTTYWRDENGAVEQAFDLRLELGRFDRSPITSTGVIPLGAWGNLPGGETFIAPLEGKAEGTFVLNGAFTGRVVANKQPLLLTFDRGLLAEVSGPAAEREAFEEVIGSALNGTSPALLALAELGIGVNEGLSELTGNALFDEKMAGTAHVAVGDNSIYGGTLQSKLHEDFITRAPSLRIDGRRILDQGKYALKASEWREDQKAAELLGKTLPEEFELVKSGLHGNGDHRGFLRVRRDVGAQRKCIYTVGSAEISPDLTQVYELLPPSPDSIRYSLLARTWRSIRGTASDEYIRGLVALLCKHQLTQWFAIEE